ncbi:MAG: LacI family transcriptional regulator [Clostridia bacterium]|nr:LacI family transcriptional regulator [Clostridia bacterium]
MKKTNINDVAQYAGVSKSTISNFLNHKLESMSVETRAKIEEAIEKLNYTPSLSARRLSAKENCKAICIIIPHNIGYAFDNLYLPIVLRAIGRVAERLDHKIIIFASHKGGVEKSIDYLKGMVPTVVDGFVIFDLEQNNLYFKEFEKANIPYVCVGKIEGYEAYQYVASNHKKAAMDAVNYLIQLGHKKIGFLMDYDASIVSKCKFEGYREVLENNHIALNERYYCYSEYGQKGISDIYNKFREMIQNKERPTAIITPITYLTAVNAILNEEGLKIPEDISIIVLEYNDNHQLDYQNFTRVPSAASRVAETAFKKLLKLIYNKKEPFKSELLDLELIIGETTARLES